MQHFYLLLLVILVATYWFVLNTVRKSGLGLTPLLGWMVGLAYFVLAPLTVLTLNGGFKFPDSYGLDGNWGDMDLSRPRFLGPYLFIWLALMLTCAVAYFFCPRCVSEGNSKYLVSRRRLEQVILITMALSLLDWIATVWLTGGIAEFIVSHWYKRQEDLVQHFGSAYILYMRTSLVNQILFTSAAALYAGEGLRRRNTRWVFTSLILLFLFIEIFMSGNRIFFATYLLSVLTSCWVYGRKKILVTLVATSPLLVIVFSVWAWVRADLSAIPDSVEREVSNADLGNPGVTRLIDVTEGAAVMLLMNIVNDFGNKYEYLYGSTYSRIFTFFQPRTIHPERTQDFATITANLYEPGAVTSLGSTALGEAWANFGVLGIFVLPGITGLALLYSERLTAAGDKRLLFCSVSFVMLIWFARSPFAENAITWIGTALLIWALKLEKGLCVRTAARKTLAPAGLPSVFPLTAAEPSA